MKKALLLLIMTLAAGHLVMAQQGAIKQVYAWTQQVSGGANPGNILQEGGQTRQSAQISKRNYFMYAECLPGVKISWSRMWLNGAAYQIRTDSMQGHPVIEIIESNDEPKHILELVPETAGPVMQLTPGPAMKKRAVSQSWLNRMISHNELIIVYVYMGKTWYFPVPKIKMLEPVPAS